jgi:hypothetical protein
MSGVTLIVILVLLALGVISAFWAVYLGSADEPG